MADIEAIKQALDEATQLYALLLGAQSDMGKAEAASASTISKAQAAFKDSSDKAKAVLDKAMQVSRERLKDIEDAANKSVTDARDKVLAADAAMMAHEAKSQNELGIQVSLRQQTGGGRTRL